MFKTNRLAVLTVKSGLDPHMIILSEVDNNLLHSFFIHVDAYVNLWDGIHLHSLVTMCLIKLDQLKVLTA